MIAFKRGDIFCTVNQNGFLGAAIHFVEILRTPTSEGLYTHAGIMISETKTYETLSTVKTQNIWTAYEGVDMIVGRFKTMDTGRFIAGMKMVRQYEGKIYPLPRLLMFAVLPVLNKYIAPSKFLGLGFFADVVCSEMVGMFAKYAGQEGFRQFRGLMPAHLASRIKRWDSIELIFEGVLQ